MLKYISTLKVIAIEMQVDFDTVTEKELKDYITRLEHSDVSEWTKHPSFRRCGLIFGNLRTNL